MIVKATQDFSFPAGTFLLLFFHRLKLAYAITPYQVKLQSLALHKCSIIKSLLK